MQEVNNLQKCIEKVEEHFNSRLENLAKLHMHSQQALQGIQQETQALQRQHKEELVSLGKQLTQARKKAAAHIRTTVDDYEGLVVLVDPATRAGHWERRLNGGTNEIIVGVFSPVDTHAAPIVKQRASGKLSGSLRRPDDLMRLLSLCD
ncbi:hypothetical protein AURDEDRAFT_172513 [Auricularia subglabra TFB-10046 SS5]|nr:hypothetical protein AURDEDRAFT_172513 [Auricularia subglabra TFB-10046 SS5]